jgi:hypothetical protein
MVAPETLKTSQDIGQVDQLCERLRQLGYAQSKRIRIYGQEFDVISNPFPQGKGIAVKAQSKREKQERVLMLPLPILQMVTRGRKSA